MNSEEDLDAISEYLEGAEGVDLVNTVHYVPLEETTTQRCASVEF